MKPDQIDYLKSITAYDFLNQTQTDGEIFNTRVVMTFLKLKFGQEGALKKLNDFTEKEKQEEEALILDDIKRQEEEDNKEIEEFVDYLENTGQLKEEAGEEVVSGGSFFWFTPAQSKAIRKTDKALEELFKAFKKGYTDNLPKN